MLRGVEPPKFAYPTHDNNILNPPHTILFFKYFIIKDIKSNIFLIPLLLDNIILQTIQNNPPPFFMSNGHQKLSFYQLLLLSCVDIEPQVMNLSINLSILSNNLPVLLLLSSILTYSFSFRSRLLSSDMCFSNKYIDIYLT